MTEIHTEQGGYSDGSSSGSFSRLHFNAVRMKSTMLLVFLFWYYARTRPILIRHPVDYVLPIEKGSKTPSFAGTSQRRQHLSTEIRTDTLGAEVRGYYGG